MDIFLGLIACIAAVFIGAYLAKKQSRIFSGHGVEPTTSQKIGDGKLPTVNYFDYGDFRFLHLGSPAVQGSMKISKPFEIHLEYQQRMMAWLLFSNLEKINQLHAMQLGLGAASLTKFCHLALGMQTTAVELNPQVIETCRQSFNLPINNHRLQVILGDASEVITLPNWQVKIDVLQVDLYDQDAESPALDSESFYTDCKQVLSENGCMTVNIFGRHSDAKESAQKIARIFSDGAVWMFKPTKAGNTIVIALRASTKIDSSELSSRAHVIESRWSLPSRQWLEAIATVKVL
jgi:spermidine synthase